MLKVQEPWFSAIRCGQKDIEGRIGVAGERDYLLSVDRVMVKLVDVDGLDLDQKFWVRVEKTAHYPNLLDYLNCEGWQNCAPQCSSFGDALNAYLAVESRGVYLFNPDAVALNGGIVALKLKVLEA